MVKVRQPTTSTDGVLHRRESPNLFERLHRSKLCLLGSSRVGAVSLWAGEHGGGRRLPAELSAVSLHQVEPQRRGLRQATITAGLRTGQVPPWRPQQLLSRGTHNRPNPVRTAAGAGRVIHRAHGPQCVCGGGEEPGHKTAGAMESAVE